jgi:DnaJ-class molecular chaperone
MPAVVVGVLVAAGAGVGYWVSLRLYPYTACPKCGGSGRNAGSNRRRWGSCRRCGGSGKRWRWGVRVFMNDRIQ